MGLGQLTVAGSLRGLLAAPLALVLTPVRVALLAVAVHRVPGTHRAMLVYDAGLRHKRRKVLVLVHDDWDGAHVGEHPLREEEVLGSEAVRLNVLLDRLVNPRGGADRMDTAVRRAESAIGFPRRRDGTGRAASSALVWSNAHTAAVISSPFLGVSAVIAGGSGPRQGHVICSGVFAVAAVTVVSGLGRGPSFGLLDGLG